LRRRRGRGSRDPLAGRAWWLAHVGAADIGRTDATSGEALLRAAANGIDTRSGGASAGGGGSAWGGVGGADGGQHQPTTDCLITETNLCIYVHLVPVAPRGGARILDDAADPTSPRGEGVLSSHGKTILAVLAQFAEEQDRVRPVFAVFRITRESFMAALRAGLTVEAILQFLDSKAHPVARAHYARLGEPLAVPQALRDIMGVWMREADRVVVRRDYVLLAFPSAAAMQVLLREVAQRSGAVREGEDTSRWRGAAWERRLRGLHVPYEDATTIALPRRLANLVVDMLPGVG
jgi:hypothetical protein